MKIVNRRIIYWTVCILYGVALTGALLYLRFPTAKFVRFCELRVEQQFPGTSCSIGSLRLGWPLKFIFEDVILVLAKNEDVRLFNDPRLELTPMLKNPFRFYAINSRAFGGQHQAVMEYDGDDQTILLTEARLSGIDLVDLPVLPSKIDRKLTGVLALNGNIHFSTKPFIFLDAQGKASISGGELGLKKPILDLSVMELTESSVLFTLADNKLELSQGQLINDKFSTSFSGSVALKESWLSGEISLQGEMIPKTQLYSDKKQLRGVVARMQKAYKTTSLPFMVNGTINRPTFRFGK